MGILNKLFRRAPDPKLKPQEVSEASVDVLIRAAVDGDLKTAESFLSRGFSVDATNDVDYTPLMAAARSSRYEMVRYLIGRGADVHRRNIYGHTPLHCAVMTPTHDMEIQKKCVLEILRQQPEIDATDKSGCTPLMHAAWFGLEPSVIVLLKTGADKNKTDEKGRTPKQLAAERKHAHIATILS